MVERLLGREQRLDLLLLGQTDGDLQTAILQAFGQRGTDAALDGQHLVVEDLILRHDLHVGVVGDDRTEVSHSRGHSPHVLWHTGAHRAPLDEEILLREGVALLGILHLHRLIRRGFILVSQDIAKGHSHAAPEIELGRLQRPCGRSRPNCLGRLLSWLRFHPLVSLLVSRLQLIRSRLHGLLGVLPFSLCNRGHLRAPFWLHLSE